MTEKIKQKIKEEMNVNKAQNYSPIMELFFKLNDKNYNSINSQT